MTPKRLLPLLLLCLLLVVSVSAAPPKIVMTVDKTEGAAPFTIKFSEDSKDATIATWMWEFGNGDTWKESKGEYVYTHAGEYTLQLTVSNDKGESAVDAMLITVTGAVETQPPTPTPTPTATPTPKPTISDKTTFVTVWTGATPIKDSIATKAPSVSEADILKTATDTKMKAVVFPYDVVKPTESTTEFKILKFRCDEKMGICGYWIAAYRDGGKEVATNSPVWISPPPITAKVSEIYDDTTDMVTTTIKEDPKLAVEQILQMYVDNQPLGKAVTGTKE